MYTVLKNGQVLSAHSTAEQARAAANAAKAADPKADISIQVTQPK